MENERPRAVFAQTDLPVIKRALQFYLKDLNKNLEGDESDAEITAISSLLHRIGRIES